MLQHNKRKTMYEYKYGLPGTRVCVRVGVFEGFITQPSILLFRLPPLQILQITAQMILAKFIADEQYKLIS